MPVSQGGIVRRPLTHGRVAHPAKLLRLGHAQLGPSSPGHFAWCSPAAVVLPSWSGGTTAAQPLSELALTTLCHVLAMPEGQLHRWGREEFFPTAIGSQPDFAFMTPDDVLVEFVERKIRVRQWLEMFTTPVQVRELRVEFPLPGRANEDSTLLWSIREVPEVRCEETETRIQRVRHHILGHGPNLFVSTTFHESIGTFFPGVLRLDI
jgi:hypothetical protein